MDHGMLRAMSLAGAACVAVGLAACSESDDGDPPTGNAPPAFSSATSVDAAENSTGVVYTATANDPDGDTLTFSINGGADAARFSITGAGALSFAVTPDFESPRDADSDNEYEVTLSVSDGMASATLNLTVTVTDESGTVAVRRVTAGLAQPLFVADRADGTNRVFVIERAGRIRILDLDTGVVAPTPFLDIATSVSTVGEFGLLGFALAPDFATSGEFYVYASNLAGDSEVRRYEVSAGDPDVADPASEDLILTFDQPSSNHNGGWIGFGPDDFLYIASGDGGGGGDPFDNGQDTFTLLGAILRIDPSSDDFPGDDDRDYAIPADNPFTNFGGAPEVYAYGLRNPFRASFDPDTGDLYIGDVGEGAIEEIDLIRPGEAELNFGWPIQEGTQPFAGGPTDGLTPPVAEYSHGAGVRQGNSVTGGIVYRGPGEALQGEYVFGDFVRGNIWSIPASAIAQGATVSSDDFILRTADFGPDAGSIDGPTSFGTDRLGRLLVTDIDGEVFMVMPE